MTEYTADKTVIYLNLGDNKKEAAENNIEKSLTEKGLLKRFKKASVGRTVTDLVRTIKVSIR